MKEQKRKWLTKSRKVKLLQRGHERDLGKSEDANVLIDVINTGLLLRNRTV